MYQSLRRINPDNSFKPDKFLFPDLTAESELGQAAMRSTMNSKSEGDRVIQANTAEFKANYLELIGSRSAAPISYMTSKHPGDVAGPISKVVVVREKDIGINTDTWGEKQGVLINLAPKKEQTVG